MTIFGSVIGALAAVAALALIYFGWGKLRDTSSEKPSNDKLRAYLMIAAGLVTLLNLFMFVTAPVPPIHN